MHLLDLLLHCVDRRGRCRECLDGLTGRREHPLVLDGHLLELRRRHDALHLWLQDCGRADAFTVSTRPIVKSLARRAASLGHLGNWAWGSGGR